jgi:hypothetical protein
VEQPLEQSEAQLLAYLDGVCARLHRVCDSGFILNPEETGTRLAVDASFIENSVDSMIAELELVPRTRTNLRALVNTACREFVASTETTFSIKTTTDDDLPDLGYSPELLLAIVLRMMQVTAESSSPTHELRLTTSRFGGNTLVSIETDVSDTSSAQPIHLRTLTLADLVQSMGGDIHVVRDSEVIRLTLAFVTNARAV